MPRSIHCAALAALLLLGVSGCVREDVNGSTITVTNELWAPFVALMGGFVAAPAGWFLRKKSNRIGWGEPVSNLVSASSNS